MEYQSRPAIVPALERATHALSLWIDRSFKEMDVSHPEAHVLGYLAHVHQCAINDLHLSFGHKRSTLTSILDRLERRGLIRREPHPRSRRLVLVRLTEEGRPIAARVGEALSALDDALVARSSEEDVAAFRRVIKIIEEV